MTTTKTAERTIHFVESGFTALGKVWRRGEELRLAPDDERWGDAKSWITLTEDEQEARWGRVYFAPGPPPQDTTVLDPDPREVARLRREANRRAWESVYAIPDPHARTKAEKALRREGVPEPPPGLFT